MELVAMKIPLSESLPPTLQCLTERRVLFAHGSGSSRHSPRNRHVADVLNRSAIGTVLLDLLTEEEEAVDIQTVELRFDIPQLESR
jgi:putative phosphoribosyl transferase